MDLQNVIEKYAQLIVDFGVKIGEGDIACISAPVECADLARRIARLAYERGAAQVTLEYTDNVYSRMRLELTDEKVLTDIPRWKVESKEYFARRKATMIFIDYPDPELYKGIDGQKIANVNKARRKALKNYSDMVYGGDCAWLLVSYPSSEWAAKVFPDLEPQEALEALWKALMHAVRLDRPDPVTAWKEHQATIAGQVARLNGCRFEKLVFRNSLGTDLTVGLPKSHLWIGASSIRSDGLEYVPNMPTEEIFTAPEKHGVNGTVVSSMPLSYSGQLIEDFRFTLKDGRVTEWQARVGQEALDRIFEADEGARYLGEVALVAESTPLAELGILFYDTLFDENASCHLALGRAYPDSLDQNSTHYEADKENLNDSLIHIDFMIGTSDLSVTGMDAAGNEIPIFTNGDWSGKE